MSVDDVIRRVKPFVAALVEQANAIVFCVGFAWLIYGLADVLTWGTASIVGGVVLMGLAAWPFVRTKRIG